MLFYEMCYLGVCAIKKQFIKIWDYDGDKCIVEILDTVKKECIKYQTFINNY
jgi:hypothetical protein